MKIKTFWRFSLLFFVWIGLPFQSSQAAEGLNGFLLRTHQPIYQNSFDLGSGGASLTRTSMEGALFVNPSLTAFGSGLNRHIVARTQIHIGKDAVDTVQSLIQGSQTGSPVSPEQILASLSKPTHFGQDLAVGWLTRFAGIGLLATTKADVELRRFGSFGVPELRVRGYGIGAASANVSAALSDILAIGFSPKYIDVTQVQGRITLAAAQDSELLSSAIQEALGRGQGVAMDGGVTLQLRSSHLDFRLSGVVTDIGNTELGTQVEPFRQSVHMGTSLTIHTRSDAVHCAADLRDVLAAYQEHWTFRLYAGCKVFSYNLFGVGAGLMQGWPTGSILLRFLGARAEIGLYTLEAGNQVGVTARGVYYLSFGLDL